VQGQIGEGLEEIKSVMESVLESVKKNVGVSAAAVGGGGDGERKKKKRKTSPSPEDETASTGVITITGGEQLSLLSRYAKLYVSSSSKLLTNTLPTQLLESLKEENRSLLGEVAIPLVEFGLEGGEREREMVLGAGLRLVGGLRDVLGEEEMDQVVAGTEGRLKKLGGMLGESKVGGEVKLEIVSLDPSSFRFVLLFDADFRPRLRPVRLDSSSTLFSSPTRRYPTPPTQTCSTKFSACSRRLEPEMMRLGVDGSATWREVDRRRWLDLLWQWRCGRC